MTQIKHSKEELENLLSLSKNIVVFPHENPDGDAIGSTLALMEFLETKNFNVSLISPNEYPAFLDWMPGESKVLNYERGSKKCKKLIESTDLIFLLDANDFSRTGKKIAPLAEKSTAKKILIDHHQDPKEKIFDWIYSDTSASSTCEMVYIFIKEILGENITPQMGTNIYTGMMTDTGSFRFPSATAKTHRIVSEIKQLGVNTSIIHQNIYDQNLLDRYKLLSRALENIKLVEGKPVAYTTLSNQEQIDFNSQKGFTEGFVNYCLSIKGIVMAAIFIEDAKKGIIKISFRSKGEVHVNEFAGKYFSGGGHHNAAGGKSDLNLEETVSLFLKHLENENF